ncbi:hypothetical protein ABZP36_013234 [Zizania latifolia]
MGSVDGDFDGLRAAERRMEVIEWLNALLPEYCLPLDSSDEELRELLSDGTALCHIVNTLSPGALEGSWGAYSSADQQSGNVKKFLSVVADMGLPGFSVKDLEEGSMSPVVDCLLVLRESVRSGLGNDTSVDGSKSPLRKKWQVRETGEPLVPGVGQGKASPGEDKRSVLPDPKSQHKAPVFSGQKLHEIFQLKCGSYADLPAAKISEMMHSNSLDNAPTQSLLSVVNGILDESIERKKGEIPHRVVYLLRKVVHEIERHLCIQAEHIRSQNVIIKTREDKYRSKIKALEILVNGTNEENQMAINRIQIIKEEKSKIEEKRKLGEQDVARLMKEKEKAENRIASLKKEMEVMTSMHGEQLKKIEINGNHDVHTTIVLPNIKVASLKDTIVRKDTEIEQLQLMRDKVKSPSSAVDINVASMPNNSNSDLGLTSLTTTNQRSQLSDPQCYAAANRDGHTLPTNITPTCLDEADLEDNVFEDGFSVGETDYSLGCAAGAFLDSCSDRTTDTSMYSLPISLPPNQLAAVNCFLSLHLLYLL